MNDIREEAEEESLETVNHDGAAPRAVANTDGTTISYGHGIVNKLIEKGVLTKDQLQIALEEMRSDEESASMTLLDVLDKLGFVSERTMMEVVNPDNKITHINLRDRILDQNIVRKLPRQVAVRYKVIVIDEDTESATIALENTADIVVIDRVKKYFDDKIIKLVQVDESQIVKAIDKYYQYSLKMSDIIAEIEGTSDSAVQIVDAAAGYQDPIVRLVDAIILDAVNKDASDIHIEPEEYFVRVRIRIDGVLITRFSCHKKYWHRLVGRVKIVAGLNIAESRKPQDGSMSMTINDKKIDFRVSVLPVVHGENVVMRILDCNKSIVSLEDLGFADEDIKLIDVALERPEGVIIITGPTGAGKTTTLYSLIDKVNTNTKNIMTLEDPVEYSMSLVRQTPINHKAGLDFASGLRALLRQDPDILLIGEIRDAETASIAVRAALTGHQVFSTLHTNDSISGVVRLIDLGVQPFLLSSSLVSIVAQRLTRRLCVCKKPYLADARMVEMLNAVTRKKEKSYTLFKEGGCGICYYTGYRSRVSVSEVFYVDSVIAEAITRNAGHAELLGLARERGFVPMQENGLAYIARGVTSVAELKRSINMSEYGI